MENYTLYKIDCMSLISYLSVCSIDRGPDTSGGTRIWSTLTIWTFAS